MSKHAAPIDPGPSAVLDLSALDVMELGTLTTMMREAAYAVPFSLDRMYDELTVVYMEARQAFIRKFFEIRQN